MWTAKNVLKKCISDLGKKSVHLPSNKRSRHMGALKVFYHTNDIIFFTLYQKVTHKAYEKYLVFEGKQTRVLCYKCNFLWQIQQQNWKEIYGYPEKSDFNGGGEFSPGK